MTFVYDKEANAIYIKLSNNKIVETLSLGNNVYLDIDSDNKAVGIEYLLSKELDSKISEILHNSQTEDIESQVEQSLANLKAENYKDFTISEYRKELRKRWEGS